MRKNTASLPNFLSAITLAGLVFASLQRRLNSFFFSQIFSSLSLSSTLNSVPFSLSTSSYFSLFNPTIINRISYIRFLLLGIPNAPYIVGLRLYTMRYSLIISLINNIKTLLVAFRWDSSQRIRLTYITLFNFLYNLGVLPFRYFYILVYIVINSRISYIVI